MLNLNIEIEQEKEIKLSVLKNEVEITNVITFEEDVVFISLSFI